MIKLLKTLLLGILVCLNLVLFSCKSEKQIFNKNTEVYKISDNREYYRIMSYNTENLFDTFHDSLKNDKDFLPGGMYGWSMVKYKDKLNHICKVIIGVGGWEPPELVALLEIENQRCLEDLTKNTALAKINYGIIHEESPDVRGVDVALLYRKNKFTPLYHKAIPINFPDNSSKKTRDILYAKGITDKNDTLHIFVNHWPSRLGGEMESEPYRTYVASVLRNVVDSIFKSTPKALIVIVGDFNDEPENSSVKDILKARIKYDTIKTNELYNLSFYLQGKGEGSHKFQGKWSMLDQIIVSGAFLAKVQPLYFTLDDAHVYKASFLLEKDETNIGDKPSRTYVGFKYNGGYSDHLPVFLDIRRK